MKLTKINYGSAVFFGAIAFVMFLASGLYLWGFRDVLLAEGVVLTWVQTFIVAPIVGAIVGYLIMIVVIVIYNAVAKKYPVAWTVAK